MAKILCVDDERDIAELVKLVLELGQHTVTVVTEPENAVSTALELGPDLILLDVVMPHVDGFDIFRELREQPSLAKIPIAFLTSNNKSVDLMVGLHVMKAEDYITKPFGKQELLDRVNTLLKKHAT
ncbi:MAG: response regulator [Fibrobacteria bacterium]